MAQACVRALRSLQVELESVLSTQAWALGRCQMPGGLSARSKRIVRRAGMLPSPMCSPNPAVVLEHYGVLDVGTCWARPLFRPWFWGTGDGADVHQALGEFVI